MSDGPIIISDTKSNFSFRMTEKVFNELSRLNIYFTQNGKTRFPKSDVISASKHVTVEPYSAFLQGNIIIDMGAFSYSWSELPAGSTVGRYCSIARSIGLLGVKHPMDRISTSSFTYDEKFIIYSSANRDLSGGSFQTKPNPNKRVPPIIGHDVWIGAGVTLGHGIKIGTGSVIAAKSIVTKDVPEFAVVGGAPARLIRYRFPENTIERIKKIEWWKYPFPSFSGIDIGGSVEIFLNKLEEKIASGEVRPYAPDAIKLYEVISRL